MTVLFLDKRTLALPVLALAIATGCGGDPEPGLLPEESAAVLERLLDAAEQRFEDGDCDQVEGTLRQLDAEIDGLPDAEVDANLRRTLNEEVVKLGELSQRCRDDIEEVVPTTVPTTPEPVAPAPVETATPEEETTETTEEEEPERDRQQAPPERKPPEPQQPPEQPKPPQPPPEEPPPEDPCADGGPRC